MAQKSSKSKTTTDHGTIRKWIEERDGQPARVKETGGKKSRSGRSGGILRIDFGEPEASLEPITWDEFFETFDKNDLAFLYQEEIEGHKSRFFKFVNREGAADEEEEKGDVSEDDSEDDDEDDGDWEEVDAAIGKEEAEVTEEAEADEQKEEEEDQGSGEIQE